MKVTIATIGTAVLSAATLVVGFYLSECHSQEQLETFLQVFTGLLIGFVVIGVVITERVTRFTIAKAVLAATILVGGFFLSQCSNEKQFGRGFPYLAVLSVAFVVAVIIEGVNNKRHKRNKCPSCGEEIDTLYYCPKCGAAVTKEVS